MGLSSFNQQNKYDTKEEEQGLDSFLPNSSCDDISSGISSDSEDDNDQQVNSEKINENDALGDMSSLVQQLPIKRGLSKHFQGKSQSFTSLSDVLCVEDLAKPENPYSKKLKSCRSYGGLLLLSSENKNGKKGSSKGSCSSFMNATRNNTSFLGNNTTRPPQPPPRSTSTNNFSNQTPLFT